ncbi:MAG: hypothetical protein E7675_00150 [Ruminococcaceae bacterium]|nr:hypothetical protein [Oscillospiraceae bacterium]
MKGWIIAGAILLFFLFVSLLKIGIVIGYKKDFTLALKILFFKIKILPAKKKKIKLSNYTKKKIEKAEAKEKASKEKKEKKKQEKKAQKQKEKQLKKDLEKAGKAPPKKKLSEKITDTVTLVKVILDIVKLLFTKLFGYIKTEVISLKIALGGKSPDQTALIYGATMAGVTALLEFLDGHSELKIKDQDSVAVVPDFPCHGFEADINIIISFRVWQIFGMIIPPAVRAAKHFIPKLLKGGDKTKKTAADKSNKETA